MKLTLPEEEHTVNEEHQNTAATGIQEDALENSDIKGFARLKLEFQKQKKQWKAMNGSEKFSYFKDYYLKPLLLGIVLIAAAVILVVNIAENFQPHALKLTILNTDNLSNKEPDFEADFRRVMNIPDSHHIVLQTSYQIHVESYEQELAATSNSNITDYEQLFAYIQSDYIDAIITDESGFRYLIETENIYNVENILTKEQLEQLSSYIVYETVSAEWLAAGGSCEFAGNTVSDEDSTPVTVAPMALDISFCDRIETLNLPYEKVYLTFPCGSEKNLEHIETLLHYLFEDDLKQKQ